jgi:hypothetical protein
MATFEARDPQAPFGHEKAAQPFLDLLAVDPDNFRIIVTYVKEPKAVELAEAIKEATAKDCVAEYISASLEEVFLYLGLGERPPLSSMA